MLISTYRFFVFKRFLDFGFALLPCFDLLPVGISILLAKDQEIAHFDIEPFRRKVKVPETIERILALPIIFEDGESKTTMASSWVFFLSWK